MVFLYTKGRPTFFINICIRQDRLAEFRHNKELPKMPTFRLISCSAPVCNHKKTKTSYGIYLFLSTIYPSGDGNLIVGELLILYNKPLQPFLSPIYPLWYGPYHHITLVVIVIVATLGTTTLSLCPVCALGDCVNFLVWTEPTCRPCVRCKWHSFYPHADAVFMVFLQCQVGTLTKNSRLERLSLRNNNKSLCI